MPPQADTSSDEASREPKVRRISNKRPRKAADTAPPPEEPSAAEAPEIDTAPKADQKRSNRRRRGKGKSGQKESEPTIAPESLVIEETIPLIPVNSHPLPEKKELPDTRENPQQNRPQPHKHHRKLDPEKIAKNAWKIFLAEVSEEGVALIGDHDARELARRCFRLSEIFLEEAEKRN